MSAVTPDELFGDAAGDLRTLKRTYAVWARAYRPDEDGEAFTHLRTLYQMAREALERGDGDDAPATAPVPLAEAPAADAPEPPPASEEPAPSQDPLEAALAQAERLARHAPMEALFVLDRAIWRRSWHADPGTLDLLLDRLELATIDGPPALIERIVRSAAMMRAWSDAYADPAVPRSFLAMLAHGWGHAPEEVARVMWRARQELHDHDLKELEAHLEAHHPAMLAMFHDLQVRMTGIGNTEELPDDPTRPPLDEPALNAFRRAVGRKMDASWKAVGDYLLRGIVWACVFLALGMVMPRWIALLVAIVLSAITPDDWLGRLGVGAKATADGPPEAPVVTITKRYTLWPVEALHVGAGIAPRPAEAHERAAAEPTAPLVQFARLRLRVLDCMTEAHVERVRQRVAQEAEE